MAVVMILCAFPSVICYCIAWRTLGLGVGADRGKGERACMNGTIYSQRRWY